MKTAQRDEPVPFFYSEGICGPGPGVRWGMGECGGRRMIWVWLWDRCGTGSHMRHVEDCTSTVHTGEDPGSQEPTRTRLVRERVHECAVTTRERAIFTAHPTLNPTRLAMPKPMASISTLFQPAATNQPQHNSTQLTVTPSPITVTHLAPPRT